MRVNIILLITIILLGIIFLILFSYKTPETFNNKNSIISNDEKIDRMIILSNNFKEIDEKVKNNKIEEIINQNLSKKDFDKMLFAEKI